MWTTQKIRQRISRNLLSPLEIRNVSRESANLIDVLIKIKLIKSNSVVFNKMLSVSGCDLESSLYCTQVDNYPVVQIESLVEKYLNKGVYFVGSDTMNHELKQRSNFVANDEHLLCETDRSAIFPKMMKNRRDEPTLIVQSRQLKQMIIVERCR